MTARKITIRGTTIDGRRFRPSDWADRLYHATATYGPDRRATFPPFIRLVIKEGIKCIEVDSQMEDRNPMLFDFLIGFGRDNQLAVTDEEGHPYGEL